MSEWAMSKSGKAAALWHFSLSFYQLPGVEETLIALQDQGGHDVNLILYALWLGWSGRGLLGERDLVAAERAAGAVREDIAAPLRALRRHLKSDSDPAVQALRERVKVLELEAERIAQSRLAACAGPPVNASPAARQEAARANLARILGPQAEAAAAATLMAALERPPGPR
jgi:uncharacterized protein (TIGR02444 family)